MSLARFRSGRAAWISIAAILAMLATVGLVRPVWAYSARAEFYTAFWIGLCVLIRRRVTPLPRSTWLDGLMAVTAAAAVASAVLVVTMGGADADNFRFVATHVAYPIGDVLLVSLVVFVFAVTDWRPGRAWWSIGLGVLALFCGDAVYVGLDAAGQIPDSSLQGISLLVALAALSLAPWQPVRRAKDSELRHRPFVLGPIVCGSAAVGVCIYSTLAPDYSAALAFAALTLALVLVRTGLTLRENGQLLELSRHEALTDGLTGLANRRAMLGDLERAVGDACVEQPLVFAIFDLNGFKLYNDSFGHPAGDALLVRVAAKLEALVGSSGRAYRMGGDEFCVLVPAGGSLLSRISAVLFESGEQFTISSAYGSVLIPAEASTVEAVLTVADERLYLQKRQIVARIVAPHEPLLRSLAEREPGLREHVDEVSDLSLAVGRRLGLSRAELRELRLAAQLHDVGKLAVPDAILQKPGPLDLGEWEFIKQHTVVGERILLGSPALRGVAKIVRSTHERWDGDGYPDCLSGEQIPLAARIVTACDAFSAIVSERPYCAAEPEETAVAELRRCAGTQFDPRVVEILCELVEAQTESAAVVTALSVVA